MSLQNSVFYSKNPGVNKCIALKLKLFHNPQKLFQELKQVLDCANHELLLNYLENRNWNLRIFRDLRTSKYEFRNSSKTNALIGAYFENFWEWSFFTLTLYGSKLFTGSKHFDMFF